MHLDDTPIPDVKVFTPRRFVDVRGFLSETYSRAQMHEAGIDTKFVQDNHSFSASQGTVRGLHYQEPPHAQAKLVWVVQGAVLDVAVDLRTGSPTFGRWTAVEISASRWNQVYVPIGFAHGFCTLEPDTHLLYKLSSEYAPEHERGIRWDDPDLGIDWPTMDHYVMSERDREWPAFADLESPFEYGSASVPGGAIP
jgi:dTDP-4-dehydrorhamnose 3,5-epimerase